ncbi:MAG: WG repeat-containing protein [Saprospiraceae bacterium]|nr:WG repeat-containing protein [Saprospiraceae bacterium]
MLLINPEAFDGVIKKEDNRYGFKIHAKSHYPYTDLKRLDDNVYLARRTDGLWGCVDSLDEKILPFEYQFIRKLIGGDLFVINSLGKMGLLSSKFETKVRSIYDDLLIYPKKNCLARNSGQWGQWGVISEYEDTIIPFHYLDIDYGPEESYRIKKEDGWGIIDSNLHLIIAPVYEQLPNTNFPGYQLAVTDSIFHLYDLEKKTYVTLDIDSIISENGMWSGLAKKESKFGIMSPNNTGPPFIYDEINLARTTGRNKKVHYYIVRIAKQYGVYCDSVGLLAPIQFDKPIFHGYFIELNSDSTTQLIDYSGKEVSPPDPSSVKTIKSKYFIRYHKDTIYSLSDERGNKIIEGKFSQIQSLDYDPNFILLKDKQGWTVLNLYEKKELLNDIVEYIYLSRNTLALRKGTKWVLFLLSKNNEYTSHQVILPLFPPNSSNTPLFKTAELVHQENGEFQFHYGIIDSLGKTILPNKYLNIYPKGDSTIMLVNKDLSGIVYNYHSLKSSPASNSPRLITHPQVSLNPQAMPTGRNKVAQGKPGQIISLDSYKLTFTDKGWKILDPAIGKEQLPDGILSIDPSPENQFYLDAKYYFWKGDKIGMLNKDLQIAIDPYYDVIANARQLSPSHPNYIYVKSDGKFALMDANGKIITPFKYDEIRAFQEDMARVRIGGSWGFINRAGYEIIPVIYDAAFPFIHGLSKVIKGQEIYFVNKDNTCVVNCPE